MIPEKAETGDTPHRYEWDESAITLMWEVFGISRETIMRMEEATTIIRDIPKEEQLRALNWMMQEIAKQRQTNVRDLCYSILRFHPLGPGFL